MAEASLNSASRRHRRTGLQSQRQRMLEILRVLRLAYPGAECSLVHSSPFQLLIATILSAQCTDERVNRVTPLLFRRFDSPEKMAKAKIGEIEEIIRSIGFFRAKAKAISETSQALVKEHGGQVPRDFEKLTGLRGVGRKTAHVVLGVAYGIPGLVVDTHVGRLSRRMGFTRARDPAQVEQGLMKVVPRGDWVEFAHLMIFHGRAICTARRADCEKCPVSNLCPKIGV